MSRTRRWFHVLLVVAAVVALGVTQGMRAQTQSADQTKNRDARTRMMRQITQADREAAAAARRAASKQPASKSAGKVSAAAIASATALFPAGMRPGGVPDYFNVGNYANSPLPVLDATGNVVAGTGIRKFVNSLPGLGAANANDLGQFIPIANAITGVPGVPTDGDYYEIGLYDYSQKMHSDLPATPLRGYRDLSPASDGKNHYLGPVIVAQRGRPVRIKFTNNLGAGTAGNLFIPVDTTVMGAGLGPDGVTSYSENRAALHLHGGHAVWISDGTPHQWITPATETGPAWRLTGASKQDVPDMPAPGAGSANYFWTNDQSGRLMFYHDHAYGTTRLNVYAGEAAGYLIWDQAEEDLISGTNVTGINPAGNRVLPDLGGVYHYGIPLVIQDKTFLPSTTPPSAGQMFSTVDPTWGTATGGQLAAQDPTWDTTKWGATTGSLWFPHVYTPNQNPSDPSGANPFGRWDYGPWFWPPLTSLAGLVHGEVMGNGTNGCAVNVRCLGVPNPSLTPESFMDTPLVNGTAYPYLTVARQAYRFRILNAANDRSLNLQIYYADPAHPTEVKMVPAVETANFPATWPTDNRTGGVPDPATAGPPLIQIGTEGGFLPSPAVIPATPIGYEYDRRSITVLNVSTHALLLGPAERADVIVDFSGVPAGSTLILYNDSPAPNPGFDSRLDYFTGDPDHTDTGGAPTTIAGYGPNTRTIMQFRVNGSTAAPPVDMVALNNAIQAAFQYDQPKPIIAQTANAGVASDTWVRIQDATTSINGVTFPLQPKAIQELFELEYGRMNATLGVELPLTNFNTQTTIPLGYVDPVTEIVTNGAPQLWKITHNGVDTHFVHFHLTDVQVVNRMGWDGTVRPPDPNETGWKDTVRMNPLEDIVVAMRPTVPGNLPAAWPTLANGSKLPDTSRIVDPTSSPGATLSVVDPLTGNFISIPNGPLKDLAVQAGLPSDHPAWEYVWHCHILGHEENDMMRTLIFDATPLPANQPAIATVSPGSGSSAGGTGLTITGSHFPSNAQVWVGGVQATAVTVNGGGTQITATTPANPAGLLADVVVATPGNMTAPQMQGLTPTPNAGIVTASLAFAYLATPTAATIAPSSGPVAGGITVTITGGNFVPGGTTVTFGGVAATAVSVTSTTSLSATLPPHAAGTVDVVVSNGTGSATMTGAFTYGGAPAVNSITPATGPDTGGTVVVITGNNFIPGVTTVTIGGTAATGVTVNSAGMLTAVTPAGAAGASTVAVTTGAGTASAAGAYTYYASIATTGVSPSVGPVAGGTAVAITASGTTFAAGTTQVTIGGAAATSVTVTTPTTLTCVTPAGAAGSAPIVVTTPPGPSIVLAGVAFTYVAAPTLTSVTPATGPASGGATVTIAGTSFVPANTTVTFNGTAAPLVSVSSPTSLAAVTPPGTAGTAAVIVTTVGGSATSATGYTYFSAPAVTGVTPAAGPLAGGTAVTITGGNFVAGSTTVTIGGVAASGVTVSSPTTLTATTPPGAAGTAAVVVTTPAGAATLGGSGFTYVAPPTATAVSPLSGTVAGGTVLTITGTNFVVGGTTVTVGGTAATSVSVTGATTLTAVTPVGAAGAAPVAVTTAGGSATFTGFSYFTNPPTIVSMAPARGRTGGGTTITITGTYFQPSGTTVTIGGAAATSVTYVTSTIITAVTPKGTAGAAPIVVTTPAGPSVSATFTYVAPSIDFNGDGIADLFSYNTTTAEALLGDLLGNYTASALTVTAGSQVKLGDFNGDGVTDLLWYDPTTGAFKESINSGTGTFTDYTGTWPTSSQLTVLDLNGDGKSDVFLYNPTTGAWTTALTTGLGTFTLTNGAIATGYTAWAGDFNGDGKGDLFLYNVTTGTWAEALSTGSGGFSFPTITRQRADAMWWPGWQVVVLDLNGDAKSDVFLYNASTGSWVECLNNGTGAFGQKSGTWATGGRIYRADLNGDQTDEVLLYNPTSGSWTESFWMAAGVYQTYGGTWSTGRQLDTADLNGDGRTDVLLYDPVTGSYTVAISGGVNSFTLSNGLWPTGRTVAASR